MDEFRELWSPWPKALGVFAGLALSFGGVMALLYSLLPGESFSILLAAVMGIPFALMWMHLMAAGAGRSAESLESRRNDVEKWARLVQDQQGAIGRGGRLILRETSLAFDATASERNMGAANWELQLNQIVSVEIIRPSPNLLAGGFRRRLRLKTHDGTCKTLLTVSKLRQTAQDIRLGQ